VPPEARLVRVRFDDLDGLRFLVVAMG